MAFIDYYKILGVDKTIPQKDVRAAYRKRAKQFHPDLHPNDPKAKAKFQALNEAYDVINDPEKRRLYDQYGEQWRMGEGMGAGGSQGADGMHFNWGGGGGSPFEGFDFSSFGKGGGGFSSFFQDLFGAGGGARGRRSTSRGNVGEMKVQVDIDLYTALLGGEVLLQVSNGAKLRLKIKPETQNGTKVRLRGKGYDRGDGTAGDMIVTYNVVLPTQLSEHQQDLLRQMRNG